MSRVIKWNATRTRGHVHTITPFWKFDIHPNQSDVLNWMRENWLIFESEDREWDLAAGRFANLFGLDLHRYDVDQHYVEFTLDPMNILNLVGIELWKALHAHDSLTPYVDWDQRGGAGNQVNLMFDEAPLTGMYMDIYLLKPLRQFMAAPCTSTSFHDVMTECFKSWVREYSIERDYAHSDEGIKELIEANDWVFDEVGKHVSV